MYISVHSVWDWPAMCGDCSEKYPAVSDAVDVVHTAIAKLEKSIEPIHNEQKTEALKKL